ncbi:MAG: DNA recombination protein RmuC [Endomicrobium sp.]|jgi:DNA recombination protein RmuC|nr:DNA recombination protein RmuC [Endomicrobium sp.]
MNNITIPILFFISGFAIGVLTVIYKHISLVKHNATKDQEIKNLTEQIKDQEKLNKNLKIEFENIASRVLEEKNMQITNINKTSFENIVNPFKIKIDEFKNNIENLQIYEAEKMSELRKELEKLIDINKKISEDANNLAGALKGESKIQGIWGELSIKRLFEYVGMTEGINYVSQKQFEANDEKKIPDYVVNLPNKKHIIIDAKTSLTAYEKYYNSQNESDKKLYLKQHSTSIKKHIDELVSKDYTNIESLNHPEYILMFIPIDGAISLAVKDRPDIMAYAFKKNIVIASPSTFLATLKTIEYIWQQEYQKKNVIEIAKQGGSLYDKFVKFINILVEADNKILEAKNKTQEAIKILCSSDKKGGSIIEKAQKLKELGAPTKKEIPEKVFRFIEKNNNSI